MIVKASAEGKFNCRKKAVKRHSGLHLFRSRVALGAAAFKSEPPSPARDAHSSND